MSNLQDLSAEDAIRRVIGEGNATDFIDVVEEVKRRYRLKVSSAQVEQIYASMQAIDKEFAAAKAKDVESLALRESSTSDSLSATLRAALRFTLEVGGIPQAKKAIRELESMLRDQ